MRLVKVLIVIIPVLSSVACGPAPAGEGPPPDDGAGDPAAAAELVATAGPAYQDVEESFTSEDDQNRWFELRRRLRQDFDDICGDTFCEGDFTNLQAMSFRCSVSTRTGQLRHCRWIFAGSYETVSPQSGNIRPVARFFHCAVPLQGTPAAALDALLAPGGRGPLWSPMPGSPRSIYDTLADCL
jgi:hypothetical protein